MTNPINAVQNFRVTVSSGSHRQMAPATVSNADHIDLHLSVGNSDVIDGAVIRVQPRPVLDAGRPPRSDGVGRSGGGLDLGWTR
jgi:hypothetical protein